MILEVLLTRAVVVVRLNNDYQFVSDFFEEIENFSERLGSKEAFSSQLCSMFAVETSKQAIKELVKWGKAMQISGRFLLALTNWQFEPVLKIYYLTKETKLEALCSVGVLDKILSTYNNGHEMKILSIAYRLFRRLEKMSNIHKHSSTKAYYLKLACFLRRKLEEGAGKMETPIETLWNNLQARVVE